MAKWRCFSAGTRMGPVPAYLFIQKFISLSLLRMDEAKQTEDPPKQFKRKYIWVFFRKFRVVLVCFSLLRNNSVCFGCFDIGSKNRNKPKLFIFGFTKQTKTNAKKILFRFVSVRTEIYFCLFRGHSSPASPDAGVELLHQLFLRCIS
jgi:hypothetical protein